VSYPLWFTASLWMWNCRSGGWSWAIVSPPRNRVSRGVWIIASLSVLGWACVLPITQPEQQLRRHVERDLYAGRIAEGLEVMSQQAPADFPPHWEPPPNIGYGQDAPPLFDVLETLESRPVADWVCEVYWKKFRRDAINLGRHDPRWYHADLTNLERYQQLLEQMPVPSGEAEVWQKVRDEVQTAIEDRKSQQTERSKPAAADSDADDGRSDSPATPADR
jgi:hypothetical protein